MSSSTLPATAPRDAKALFAEKFRKLDTRYKWLVVPAILLAAPISYFIAYALFGATLALVSGTTLALAWLVIVNKWPSWSMRLANYRLRELKAEAERHPIETLQNEQVVLEAGLVKEADKITELDTGVEDYRTYLKSEAVEHPEAALAGLPTLRNMEQLLIFRRRKWQDARSKLNERARKVKSAEAKYRVALKAQALARTAGENEQTVLSKILEDIAFATVDSRANESMAALRTAVMMEQLPEGEVIDMSPAAFTAPEATLRLSGLELNAALDAPLEVQNVRRDVVLSRQPYELI